MKNTHARTTSTVADNSGLLELMRNARLEERKDQLLAFSLRLAALSIRVQKKECSAIEIIELLRDEAEQLAYSAQEIIV